MQDDRLLEAHRLLIEAERGSEQRAAHFRRLHVEAHFLLIALAHVLGALKVCAEVLGDEEIKSIRDDFEARVPWIKQFRNVLEHLDEYTAGGGELRRRGDLPEEEGLVLAFEPLGRPLEVVALLGRWRLPLRAAAQGGARLGLRLAEAWEKRFGPEEPRVIWGRLE
jgi:hypothetical protein